MYDELKERCRACSQGCTYPSECSYFDKPPLRCMRQLLSEVADAIEKLSAEVLSDRAILKRYGGETGIKNLQEYANKYWDTLAKIPRWIPVTERLPEESEGLRWREELTLRFTSVWCCDVNTGTIEVRNRLQGKKTGIEFLDRHTKDTNWHWSQSWWEPTHWMPIVPLPEPPKEET